MHKVLLTPDSGPMHIGLFFKNTNNFGLFWSTENNGGIQRNELNRPKLTVALLISDESLSSVISGKLYESNKVVESSESLTSKIISVGKRCMGKDAQIFIIIEIPRNYINTIFKKFIFNIFIKLYFNLKKGPTDKL